MVFNFLKKSVKLDDVNLGSGVRSQMSTTLTNQATNLSFAEKSLDDLRTITADLDNIITKDLTEESRILGIYSVMITDMKNIHQEIADVNQDLNSAASALNETAKSLQKAPKQKDVSILRTNLNAEKIRLDAHVQPILDKTKLELDNLKIKIEKFEMSKKNLAAANQRDLNKLLSMKTTSALNVAKKSHSKLDTEVTRTKSLILSIQSSMFI